MGTGVVVPALLRVAIHAQASQVHAQIRGWEEVEVVAKHYQPLLFLPPAPNPPAETPSSNQRNVKSVTMAVPMVPRHAHSNVKCSIAATAQPLYTSKRNAKDASRKSERKTPLQEKQQRASGSSSQTVERLARSRNGRRK